VIFYLVHDEARRRAIEYVRNAPDGYKVEVKAAPRSIEQNALMWSLLNEISRNVIWHGRKLPPESWKIMATAALKKQDVVPGIDGNFVVLGSSTSRMTKNEMTELIEFLQAFAVQQNVVFGTDEEFV
jgi:hypothetical protein